MKKYFLFAVVALLLLTGCGKKQVVCSATEEEGGVKVTESIIGELDSSDKITKVSMEMEYPDTDSYSLNHLHYNTLFDCWLHTPFLTHLWLYP